MKAIITKDVIRQSHRLAQTLFNSGGKNSLTDVEMKKLALLAKHPKLERLDVLPQDATKLFKALEEAEQSRLFSIYY